MSAYLTRRTLEPAAGRERVRMEDGIARRWMRGAVQEWRRRRMVQALEELDDRILTDIGIRRRDIPRAVEGLDPRELRMTPPANPA